MSQKTSQAVPFHPGDILAGRYRIQRYIAQGAVGVVFEAEDLELGENVAIKLLRSEYANKASTVARFLREIQLARRVTHPNVCRIFDLGRHQLSDGQETIFLSMELLRGQTLREWIQQNAPASPEQVLPILDQVVDALETAHQAGVVHRDFKPSNVVLELGGEEMRAVITDFGLSRLLAIEEDDDDESLTRTGHFVGTPAYIAPEQLQNDPIGPATDLYSLGTVLYEMVTGRLPFTGDNPIAAAFKRLRELPTPPERHRPDLPRHWSRTILRCLEVDPARRHSSAKAMLLDLQNGPPTTRPNARYSKLGRYSLTGLLVACVVALGVWVSQPSKFEPPSTHATPPRRSVAVLPFEDRSISSADNWLAGGLPELLRTELGAGGLFLALPGDEVHRVLQDLELADRAQFTVPQLDQVAQLAAAPVLVTGSFQAINASQPGSVRLRVRATDRSTGLSAEGEVEGQLTEAAQLAESAAKLLREQLGVDALPASEKEKLRAAQPVGTSAPLYTTGLEQLRGFNAPAARETLEQAVEADPTFPLTYAALSEAWSRLGYDKQAIETARKAFDLSSDLPREQQLIVEARYRSSLRQHSRVFEIYRTLHNFYPDNDDYAVNMAESLLLGGRPLETLEAIEKIEATVLDPRLLLVKAKCLREVSRLKYSAEVSTEALKRARDLGSSSLQSQALLELAGTRLLLGLPAEARGHYEESLSLAQRVGDQSAIAAAQTGLAEVLDGEGDFARAQSAYLAPLKTYREIGDNSGITHIYGKLAYNCMRRREFDQASSWLDEGEELSQKLGDPYKLNDLRHVRGVVFWEQGRLDESEKTLEAVVIEERRLNRLQPLASALNNLANTLYDLGKSEAALRLYQEALQAHRKTGFRRGEADTLNNLGTTLWLEGNLPAAQDRFEAALLIYRDIEHLQGQSVIAYNLGEMSYDRGQNDKAIENLSELIKLYAQQGLEAEIPSAQLSLALAELAAGNTATSLDLAQKAAQVLRDNDDKGQVWAQAVIAKNLLVQGDAAGARVAINRAGDHTNSALELELSLSLRIIQERIAARLDSPNRAILALGALQGEARRNNFQRQALQAMLALGEAEALANRPAVAGDYFEKVKAEAQSVGFGLYVNEAQTQIDLLAEM